MRARYLVGGSAAAAYVAGSHWLMTEAPASNWNAVVIVGPMLALITLWAWQRRQRLLAALVAFAAVGLLTQAWQGGGLAPTTLYLAQHAGIHVALALVFGATLGRGEPLIAALARRVHGGRLSAAMAAYCRGLTLAWTIYFLAMAALSVLLFWAAPFRVWATFANLVTPLVLVVFFVGEHLLRYRLHPEFERATLRDAIRAYRGERADRAGGTR
jgi:uncharacterized membrane protein